MPGKAPTPADSSVVISSEPAKPPMLNKAWKPDISGRPEARSTSTAWTFIATSIEPRAAPNSSKAPPRVTMLDATDRKGSTTARPIPPAMITGRLP